MCCKRSFFQFLLQCRFMNNFILKVVIYAVFKSALQTCSSIQNILFFSVSTDTFSSIQTCAWCTCQCYRYQKITYFSKVTFATLMFMQLNIKLHLTPKTSHNYKKNMFIDSPSLPFQGFTSLCDKYY